MMTNSAIDMEHGLLDVDDYGSHPVARQVTIAGIKVNLVNWFDYRGWEVRVANTRGATEQPAYLGHIHAALDRFGQTVWTDEDQRTELTAASLVRRLLVLAAYEGRL